MKQEEIIRSATAYENARTACGKHEPERASDKLAIGIAGKVAAARQIVIRPVKIDALRLVDSVPTRRARTPHHSTSTRPQRTRGQESTQRSEEHTSEHQSLIRKKNDVYCWQKKKNNK